MPLVYFLLGVAVGTVGVQKIIDIATNYINHLGQHITRIGNNVYQITTTTGAIRVDTQSSDWFKYGLTKE